MKLFRFSIIVLAALLIAMIAVKVSIFAAAGCALALASSQLAPDPECRVGMATLVLNILTGKIMNAFRGKVPELSYFSTDLGKSADGIFAAPVKWGQEVISQIVGKPTASNYTPGDALTTGATNVKTLVTDVKVKINRAKVIPIKLPTSDAVALFANGPFMKVLEESGISLGRAVVQDAFLEANKQNFSHAIEEAASAADYDTLDAARKQLNSQGAATPRFFLGNADTVGNIALDPDVRSGDYHGQQMADDPYVLLTNIRGFTAVREFPDMPSGTRTIGTFTAATTDICTLVAHGLKEGDRVRLTTTTTLPAGLALATSYYIKYLTVDTFKLSATNGGAAIDITDTGTGVHTLSTYEELNAFAFEQRAIHIVVRQLNDNDELAAQLGIPKTFLTRVETDPETGLTFTVYMYQEPTTRDIYAAVVVYYGIVAGRQANGFDTAAGSNAADTALDPAGLRIVQATGAL